MLLSVDWDAYSGTRELVFDAPIWGSPDRNHDRLEAWRLRAKKRGSAAGWDTLAADFPLYSGWQALRQYAGLPAFVTLSHADIWPLLERWPGPVLNIDSHCDLVSRSGDPMRLRPGNWAGLGLDAGLVTHYECRYPTWHAELPVAEGFDLARTHAELVPELPADVLERVTLSRSADLSADLPPPSQVAALVLVQSPAWTSPAHDAQFWEVAGWLKAEMLVLPMRRQAATGP